MCQLTYIDFRKDVYLSPWFIKWLITANSMEGHKDGFGYFLEKDRSIVKTERSALDWLNTDFVDTLSSIRNTNGIYHVRRASVNLKEIKQYNAHPFRDGNIVLAHNGTLELQFSHIDTEISKDIFKDDMIDSQKYLVVLSRYLEKNGNVLDETVIKNALTEFSGSYVLLIRDITTNTLWIAKDETKELNIAIFSSWGDPCGIIINTRHYMLDLMSEIILDSKRNTGLGCTLESFGKDIIMKYEIGSYKLPDKVCDFKTPVKRYNVSVPVTKAAGSVAPLGNVVDSKNGITPTFFEDVKKCFLTLEDLFLLYEIQFGKPILDMDTDDYFEFIKLVGHISKVEWTERRAEPLKTLFAETENSIMSPIFSVFPKDGDIVFPLIANGKSLLEGLVKNKKTDIIGVNN